ncbi:hypothetical protein WMF41_31360 [Sorangium sp. So ce1151]
MKEKASLRGNGVHQGAAIPRAIDPHVDDRARRCGARPVDALLDEGHIGFAEARVAGSQPGSDDGVDLGDARDRPRTSFATPARSSGDAPGHLSRFWLRPS